MHRTELGSRFPFVALAAGLVACAGTERPAEQASAPASPPVVQITATDYAFQMPDTIPAGVTTFRLANTSGSEFHHVVLIRLPDGMSMQDFLGRMSPGSPPPPDAVFLGGPNPAEPSGDAEATVDLPAGGYAVVCVIPSPDGTPHVAKGMARPLTVVAGTSSAALPTPDVTVTLTDYDFQFSAPLTPGRHVIRIQNAADQPHELVFFKLNPGKTVEDMARYAEKPEGPPPGSAIDGVSPLSKGKGATVVVTLEAGDYGLICFIPDAAGKPHLVLGMMKQVKVS
ncbi:MAG: hypothetical protein ACRENB_02345 [Gemmatimonadales bacterium]